MENKNLPTIAELTTDLDFAQKSDELNLLLNQQAPKDWIKQHPFIKSHTYMPIDKVEHLLKKIFKNYRIEITGQGHCFNGVWVTVRVHYQNLITGEWSFHDGIGSSQLQTKKDTSPSDLININNGALSMAFPLCKTLAIKDACHHFGKLFGSDLNRKDTIDYYLDVNLKPNTIEEVVKLFELKKESLSETDIISCERIIKNEESKSYKKLIKFLKNQ